MITIYDKAEIFFLSLSEEEQQDALSYLQDHILEIWFEYELNIDTYDLFLMMLEAYIAN